MQAYYLPGRETVENCTLDGMTTKNDSPCLKLSMAEAGGLQI
jgi:hypothetical protein